MKTVLQSYTDKRTYLMILGSNIRDIRKHRYMSLSRVSNITGISKGALSRIENGRVDPQITTLVKIAWCLDVDITLLISASVNLIIP